MSMSIDTLTAAALSLPPDQRFELAQRLWESVEGQLDEDDELFAEIERRDAEIESGAVQTLSHEEVMREVRKTLGK